MNENLEPRSVKSFDGFSFRIPDYQRGYRWTPVEVEKLLKDLNEYFELDDNERPEFYSLQPLVVYKDGDTYEVLDGQQRLTTLYLIYKYLGHPLYTLDYDTRKESKEYISHIGENPETDKKAKYDNIDNYHIFNACDTIKNYLDKDKNKERFKKFKKYLTIEDDHFPDLRFIWYDISPEVAENPEDTGRKEKIFSRLNVGKIGLTNAELIKALFINRISKQLKYHPSLNDSDISQTKKNQLRQELETPLRLRIAGEWDMIEKSLSDKKFWAFVYGAEDGKYDTRIEFIFDNIVDAKGKKRNKDDKNFTFESFQELLKSFDSEMKKLHDAGKEYYDAVRECEEKYKNTIDSVWHEVTDTFYRYQNWYKDRTLYHLLGFLRYLKLSFSEIDKIRSVSETNTNFVEKLKEKIRELVFQVKKETNKDSGEKEFLDIEELSYDEPGDKQKIRDVLVLFNVLSVMSLEKTELKFSFDELYGNSFDIEHIRSQHPKEAKKGDEREDWIVTVLEYFSGLNSGIHEIPEKKDESKKRKEKIAEFYTKLTPEELAPLEKNVVCTYFDENKEEKTITAKYVCEELKKIWKKETSLQDEKIFRELTTKVFSEKDYDSDGTHKISNLALLDSNTNRGYKNSFFPVKRHWILEREKNGFYIPPCTKNVFQKFYSSTHFDLMNWTDTDAQAYLNEMKEVFKKCLETTAQKQTQQK